MTRVIVCAAFAVAACAQRSTTTLDAASCSWHQLQNPSRLGQRGRADYRRCGADHVIEIGGAGTLAESYRALGFGGNLALIVFWTGPGDPNPMPLMTKDASLHGIGAAFYYASI
ncbi:MAG TPA: hypothetical protein VIY49_17860 [Bryobacteraceae bacterium]